MQARGSGMVGAKVRRLALGLVINAISQRFLDSGLEAKKNA